MSEYDFWKTNELEYEITDEDRADWWDEKERREREEDEPLPGRAL